MSSSEVNAQSLAKKIYEELSKRGSINPKEIKAFIECGRTSGKEIIKHLIDLVPDPQSKKNLYDMYTGHQYRYDPRLEIIALWVFATPKESDPERT